MIRLGLQISAQAFHNLIGDVRTRMANPSPVLAMVPDTLRFGAGGLEEQVRLRRYEGFDGIRAWQEPSYASGALPAAARARENVFHAALLGRGPGSVTSVTKRSATVSVDDGTIKAVLAMLGNGLVSTADYADFYFGGFARRFSPGLAKPVKPTNPANRRRRGAGAESRPKPRNFSAYAVRWAMWWYLGWTYNYWASEAELRAGIPTPPHNVGWNARVADRLRDAFAEYIIGAGALARGRALDPRAA